MCSQLKYIILVKTHFLGSDGPVQVNQRPKMTERYIRACPTSVWIIIWPKYTFCVMKKVRATKWFYGKYSESATFHVRIQMYS